MLCFRKILLSKNFMDKREGKNQVFPSNFFCLEVPKKFVGQPFSVLLTSGIENFCASEGYVTIPRRTFFDPQYQNILKGTPLCCVSKNFC